MIEALKPKVARARSELRICVIDDEWISLNVIRSVIKRMGNVEVESFPSAQEAIRRCKETTFDLILIDYQMPNMNGVECIKQIRTLATYAVIPAIMLTADNNRELRLAAITAGATDFINKPFDPEELRVRVKNLLDLREAQKALLKRAETLDFEVQQATQKLRAREEDLIYRLSQAIEMRDGATGQHVSRVAAVSQIIAREMGLSEGFCRTIFLAAPLHDTGKIGISDAILHKPGKLTPQERIEIEKHTSIGAQILANGQSDLINMAHEIALYHHEKWDGTGYGAGLVGEEIPLSSRISAIADVFDALCSRRSYKPAWPFEKAFQEVLNQSGAHFDPKCVAAFSRARSKIEDLYGKPNSSNSAA